MSAGTFGYGLGGLLCGLGFNPGVMIYVNESDSDDGGSLALPRVNILKCVPENVTVAPISFILHEYCPNHGLIRCFSNQPEWVDSIWCDLD